MIKSEKGIIEIKGDVATVKSDLMILMYAYVKNNIYCDLKALIKDFRSSFKICKD